QTLWRRKWIILACAVIVPVGAYFSSARQPKQYRSTALVEVQSGDVDTSLFLGGGGTGRNADASLVAAARLTRTTAMAKLAARKMANPPANPRSLLGQLTVTPDTDSGFITITAVA